MAIKLISAPNIGQRLRKHVTDKRIFQSGWAREQGISRLVIARYLKQPTIKIDTLFTISQVLKYNFIREIADQLPAELPPVATNPLQQRVDELEKENEKLRDQVALLKEVMMKG